MGQEPWSASPFLVRVREETDCHDLVDGQDSFRGLLTLVLKRVVDGPNSQSGNYIFMYRLHWMMVRGPRQFEDSVIGSNSRIGAV